MITLTSAQREFMVNAIVHSINDAQVSDEYSFGTELDIVWSSKNEAYRMIPAKGKTSWASPSDIIVWIEDLSDQALLEGYCECEYIDVEEFEEHIADELETAE
jgi:hypothetical protein